MIVDFYDDFPCLGYYSVSLMMRYDNPYWIWDYATVLRGDRVVLSITLAKNISYKRSAELILMWPYSLSEFLPSGRHHDTRRSRPSMVLGVCWRPILSAASHLVVAATALG